MLGRYSGVYIKCIPKKIVVALVIIGLVVFILYSVYVPSVPVPDSLIDVSGEYVPPVETLEYNPPVDQGGQASDIVPPETTNGDETPAEVTPPASVSEIVPPEISGGGVGVETMSSGYGSMVAEVYEELTS
jgi:hypothetical protein